MAFSLRDDQVALHSHFSHSADEYFRLLNRNKAAAVLITVNPPINWPAYETVQRGFLQLIQKRAIEEAKALALKLIHNGSYQIECSDEGLMQEEIESCLRPVISAVRGLPGGDAWASEMLRRDRMGMLCRPELTALAARPASPDTGFRRV